MATHTVTNQAPPRVDVDEFGSNIPLVAGVTRYDASWALPELRATGRLVGSAEFITATDEAHRLEPQLVTHDRYGHRIDEVRYAPGYHRVIAAAVAAGAHTSAWADPRPGANVARAAQFMMFAQVEPGHACPISMTHAVVPSLEFSPDLLDAWRSRLYSRSYDRELGSRKSGCLFGMGMTEKQGGSDVRANSTVAVDAGDGSWRLTGHKWFCSAPMSDAFLMLAQAPQGLSCFLVPRVLDDGTRNVFMLQRLKDKCGNRSNASAEVEIADTVGFLVGEEGRGVRTIIEMVARTRLDNVLGAAAGMRQAVAEAVWHARHRSAFGALLADQPAMTAVLADLALESEAATTISLRLARAHDADASESDVLLRRLATAIAKYWVTKRGPEHAYEAMECLGGNGYIEDFPLARRYREQPVMAIWEGSGNVIALDVLRALAREPKTLNAFEEEVGAARGAYAALDAHLDSTLAAAREASDLARAGDAGVQRMARRLVADLAVAMQASLLATTAPNAVADAFVATRIGGLSGGLFGGNGAGGGTRSARLYGELPRGADLGAILERA